MVKASRLFEIFFFLGLRMRNIFFLESFLEYRQQVNFRRLINPTGVRASIYLLKTTSLKLIGQNKQ